MAAANALITTELPAHEYRVRAADMYCLQADPHVMEGIGMLKQQIMQWSAGQN
jgi:hypothetical protein